LTDSNVDLTSSGSFTNPNTPESHTPPRPPVLCRIFIGEDGLRAGWSILIFLVLFAALLKGAGSLARATHLLPPRVAKGAAPPDPTPRFAILSEAIPLAAALFISWIMASIERRPTSYYGLGGRHKLSHFFAGLAWGVTFLSILVLILWKFGLLIFDARLLYGIDTLRYGAAWLLGFLMVALLEEYLTRGYLQYTLARGLAGFYKWAFQSIPSRAFGFWTAALILSLLFGLGHSSNSGESPIGLLSAGLAGLVFVLSLWRTGSLWWAIGFHTSWDWAQSFLYGVADSGIMIQFHLIATHPVGKPLLSGGTTGPEGSIFVLPILALIALTILFTLSPAGTQAEPAAQPSRTSDPA
jgi:membrane protease YdiL (CAAX protease family)